MSWWAWLVLSFAILLLVYAALVAAMIVAGRRADARALATFVPDCIVLVSRLLRAARVPRRRKVLLIALVLRSLVRSGGESLIRELWPGPEQSLGVILRLAR